MSNKKKELSPTLKVAIGEIEVALLNCLSSILNAFSTAVIVEANRIDGKTHIVKSSKEE